MGLLISTFTNSQIAAIFGTAVLTILPAANFSGMIDPVSSLEGMGRLIGEIYPTTHFLTIARGTFSKALNFSDLQAAFLPLALAVPVQLGLGRRFLKPAWGALRAGVGNMDLLVVLGTWAAFGLSLYLWVVHGQVHHLYFEAAAAVIVLVLFGRWMEGREISLYGAARTVFTVSTEDSQMIEAKLAAAAVAAAQPAAAAVVASSSVHRAGGVRRLAERKAIADQPRVELWAGDLKPRLWAGEPKRQFWS